MPDEKISAAFGARDVCPLLESLVEDFEDVDLSLVCEEAVGRGFDGDAAAMARFLFAPEVAKLFRVSKKCIVTRRAS